MKMVKFSYLRQKIILKFTKAKFDKNNGHFLMFCNEELKNNTCLSNTKNVLHSVIFTISCSVSYYAKESTACIFYFFSLNLPNKN